MVSCDWKKSCSTSSNEDAESLSSFFGFFFFHVFFYSHLLFQSRFRSRFWSLVMGQSLGSARGSPFFGVHGLGLNILRSAQFRLVPISISPDFGSYNLILLSYSVWIHSDFWITIYNQPFTGTNGDGFHTYLALVSPAMAKKSKRKQTLVAIIMLHEIWYWLISTLFIIYM